jgi:hypothetical protein
VNTDSTTGMIPLGFDFVKRAQHGDADAFAALFLTHKARVYSLMFAYDKQYHGG